MNRKKYCRDCLEPELMDFEYHRLWCRAKKQVVLPYHGRNCDCYKDKVIIVERKKKKRNPHFY